MRRWKAEVNAWRLQLGDAWGAAAWCSPGTSAVVSTIGQSAKPSCASANVTGKPNLRVHDLRDTAATLMLLARVKVKVVGERVGHATIATTLQT